MNLLMSFTCNCNDWGLYKWTRRPNFVLFLELNSKPSELPYSVSTWLCMYFMECISVQISYLKVNQVPAVVILRSNSAWVKLQKSCTIHTIPHAISLTNNRCDDYTSVFCNLASHQTLDQIADINGKSETVSCSVRLSRVISRRPIDVGKLGKFVMS